MESSQPTSGETQSELDAIVISISLLQNKREKRNKIKIKISEPEGEIFPHLFKKLRDIADRPARSVAYEVLHIFKSAGFSQKYRNGLRSVKATAYRGDYFHQGFVAGLCLDRSATMRQ